MTLMHDLTTKQTFWLALIQTCPLYVDVIIIVFILVEEPKCIDIDECIMTPCTNGGTCQNTIGSYVCKCPPKFFGKHCDHSK